VAGAFKRLSVSPCNDCIAVGDTTRWRARARNRFTVPPLPVTSAFKAFRIWCDTGAERISSE
jgi:hypothetical protein